ncbi:MAG TPA: methyltransferase domain-containing protein [Xanthobacteraceae bacterium]|nr:methyltransferase domain-containing protein [Xanthobacteraceae bacterium]
MNRKERRAGHKRGNPSAGIAPAGDWDKAFTTADLLAQARRQHQQRQPETARDICNRILAREPAHVPALNLLGLIFQETGHHKLAVKALAKAIASDDLNAACHYNLASSYQALDRPDEAALHFKTAIGLGMSQKNIEDFVFQNPTITAWINRVDESGPLLPARTADLLGDRGLQSIANDIFLRCALETMLIRTEPLERLFTHIRSVLLGSARASAAGAKAVDGGVIRLLCALAQQCFINEYVFVQSDEETRHAIALRDLLLTKLADGDAIAPLLLAAVAAYFPLHSLPGADALLRQKNWPEFATGLLRRQLSEPLEEAADIKAIPALTRVDDQVSRAVMQQYEENPYPRWTINPVAAFAADRDPPAAAGDDNASAREDILIAGCGSGQHAFQVAYYFPDARVLAVDISLASLAYARRKSREAGLRHIDYAQADILALGAIGRSFDRIEAVGVLHHLADPEVGWRVLASLLRSKGVMRIGLYSEAARRDIVAVRAFIAERGYRPLAEDIRKCRQEIFRDFDKRRWKSVIEVADFYSMSGCRDMLFNVMEHRFTIPRIKTFLDEQRLSFLGFELEPTAFEKFQTQFPGDAALTDLESWHAFEAGNPQTFRSMYVFTVRKD